MIESITRFWKQGGAVSVNNNYQVIFYNPDTDKFFAIANPTKKEIDHIYHLKTIGFRRVHVRQK